MTPTNAEMVTFLGTRPRDPFSPAAEALRRHLTAQLQDEVDRAFAEQEVLH